MWEDPIVSDVRRAREELSAKFDFDIKAIFADLRDRQATLGGRLARQQAKQKTDRGEDISDADSRGVSA